MGSQSQTSHHEVVFCFWLYSTLASCYEHGKKMSKEMSCEMYKSQLNLQDTKSQEDCQEELQKYKMCKISLHLPFTLRPSVRRQGEHVQQQRMCNLLRPYGERDLHLWKLRRIQF